jgi:hypothetical protein
MPAKVTSHEGRLTGHAGVFEQDPSDRLISVGDVDRYR